MSAFTRDTPLRGTTAVTAAQAIAYAASKGARGTYAGYLLEVWALGARYGLNPLAVMGQWADETGDAQGNPGRSPRWLRGDPAGIGIFADDTVSTLPAGLSGAASARIHVGELLYKMTGSLPSGLTEIAEYDPHLARVAALVRRPGWPAVATLHDLRKPLDFSPGDFVWAANPAYGDQIAGHMNAIAAWAAAHPSEEATPMAELAFGRVQHPPFVDRLIPSAQNGAWDDLGPRNPVGVCQHTMVGTLAGTDQWFRRGAASTGLTDYGVGLDGLIYRWNDPRGRRAGWANGGSDGLEGDGPLFVRTLGIDAINRDLVSIERDDAGKPDTTPFAGAQLEACAQLTAYWFDQARVPWSSFPVNPAVGIVTHMEHFEFTSKAGNSLSECPAQPVRSQTDVLQDRIRAILKAAQTATPGAPAEPPPKPVAQDHDAWPNGWTLEQLAARWGVPRRIDLDGKARVARFSAKGPLSNAWVARAVKEGITRVGDVPRPVRIVEIAQPDSGLVASMAIFDGRGTDNWAVYRPGKGIAWRWVQ